MSKLRENLNAIRDHLARLRHDLDVHFKRVGWIYGAIENIRINTDAVSADTSAIRANISNSQKTLAELKAKMAENKAQLEESSRRLDEVSASTRRITGDAAALRQRSGRLLHERFDGHLNEPFVPGDCIVKSRDGLLERLDLQALELRSDLIEPLKAILEIRENLDDLTNSITEILDCLRQIRNQGEHLGAQLRDVNCQNTESIQVGGKLLQLLLSCEVQRDQSFCSSCANTGDSRDSRRLEEQK